MDLEKLINQHDHGHNLNDPKECPCRIGQEIQREFMRKHNERVEELIALHNSHTNYEDCSCSLANAIRNYQLAFQKTVSLGVFVKDKDGKIIARDLDDKVQNISYESVHVCGESTLTPDSYMRLHSRILPRISDCDDEYLLQLEHHLQILVDGAKAGLGIVKAYRSDRLKRATEEVRNKINKADKEWKEGPKKSIKEKVEVKDQITKEEKKLNKLLAQLEMLTKMKENQAKK